MGQVLIDRVYDVKVLGYEAALKNIQQINTAFKNLDTTKRKTDEQLRKAVEAGNAGAIEQLQRKIKELETAMKNLDAQREKSAKEIALLAKAEKDEAAAAAIRTKSIIDQEKELDRQIAGEEKRAKKTAEATKAQGQNYYALVVAMKQAMEAYRQYDVATGTSEGFEKVKREAIEAKAKVDAFNRSLSPDGTLVGEYKSGILNAFKELGLGDFLKNQKNDLQNQINQLIQKNKELAAQYRKTSTEGGDAFQKIDAELRESILLQEQMEANLRHINQALNEGSIGSQIIGSISNEFKNLKQNIAQVLVGYVGFQAAVSGVQSLVRTSSELSDRYVDLKRILGATKEEANSVVESLKQIDTRTSLTSLVDTAIIAAKAGVAKENIAGVTKALDELQLVAGKELGNIEQTTTSLVKLINIFEGPGKTTEENIRRYGNALVELANKGVASGGFLVDYAQRLAGIEGITKIQINSVLGLAAAFEEQGQTAEVSATATTQILSKIGGDVEKFAKIAGKTKEAFQDTLRSNPAEALIQLAQGVKGNATAFDEIAPKFADLEARGVRVQSVLGVLADKADFFREKIGIAGVALQNTSAITEGAAEKQRTFGAVVEKISKQFELLGNNRTVQVSLSMIAGLLYLLFSNLAPLVALVALYGIGWLTVAKEIEVAGVATSVTNGQLLLQRATLIGNNILLGLTRLYTAAATVAQSSYNAALALYAGIMNRAAVATILFGNATRLIGLGAIITIIAILLASFKAFSAEVTNTGEALKKMARQQQIANEISQKANTAVAEQTSVLAGWVAVVKSATASADTKKAAIQKLIEQYPEFSKALKGEVIDLNEVQKAYESVTRSIRAKAEAEASTQLTAEKQKDVLSITALRQRLEIENARGTGSTRSINGLSKEELDKLFSGVDLSKVSVRENGKGGITFDSKDFARIIGNLRRQENDAIKVYQDYVEAQAKTQAKLAEIEETAKKDAAATAAAVAKGFEVDIPFIQGQIEDLDKKIKGFQGRQKDLDKLIAERKKLQDRLDAALNKEKKGRSYGGAKLSGEQKDAFKDVDAVRDTELADAKRLYQASYIDEVTYLQDVLAVNKKAIDDKLKLIKGANAEERKVRADLLLDRVTQEQDTNKKLFDIYSKQAENELKTQQRIATDKLNQVLDDPSASPTAKNNARQQFNSTQLTAQLAFNAKMEELELKYRQKSVENESKRAEDISKILKQIRGDRQAELDAEIADIQLAGEKQLAAFNKVITEQRLAILKSKKSQNDKSAAINELDRQSAIGSLSREVDSLEKQLPLYQEKLQRKQITEKEYQDWYDGYVKRIENLNNLLAGSQTRITNLQDLVTSKLSKLFGFGVGTDKEKLLAETLAKSYQLAENAMNSYYDRKFAFVEREKEIAYKRIDIEKQQLLNQAQSQAERESLERQAASKKEQADREAFEKSKKIQKAQAAVNLGIQLSNLAVIAFSPNPLNIATLGTAGAIMYAAQALLAIANYGMNIQKINSASYAGGGYTGPGGNTDHTGHRVAGVVHDNEWVSPKWMVQHPTYGPVINQLEGVRRKGYAAGGFTGLGTGTFGGSLRPPINSSAYLLNQSGSNGSSEDIAELKRMVADVTGSVSVLSNTVKTIKVQVVAREVQAVNTKTAKATSIGTL